MKDSTKRKLLQSVLSRKIFQSFQSLFFKVTYKNEPLLNEYKKNGLVVLSNFFSIEECDKILTIVDDTIKICKNGSLYSTKIKTIDSDQIYYNSKRLIYSFDFKDTDSYINKIVNNTKIKEICEYLNHSKLKPIQHWTKRVYPRNELQNHKIMMNESWHQDSGGLSMIRFIVYLNDVDEEQGPFEYIKGSHKKEIKDISKYIKNNRDKIMKISGKKGDVIIADVTGGWHKANKVISGQRDTLQVAFMSPLSDKINKLIGFGTYLKKS